MSPIYDINRGLPRVGKLRMGEQVEARGGGTRPSKLATWRVTSGSRDAVEAVAQVYGGAVQPWDAPDGSHQFEVVTEAVSLDVLITPEDDAFSQWNEQWSAAGCLRRCDGRVETLTGEACKCPANLDERAELAAKGNACKATTRVSVVLPKVAALGSWMLETHGRIAAKELGSVFDLLDLAGARRGLLPARLRIEQRVSKKDGETRKYGVPMIDIARTFDDLLALPPAGVDAVTGEIGGPFDTPALDAPKAEPVTSTKKAAAKKAAASKSITEAAAEVKDDPISDVELAQFRARIAVLDETHRALCATLMNNARVTLKTTPKKSEARVIEQTLGAVEAKQAEAWEDRRKRVFAALGPLDLSDEQRHQFVLDATSGETDSTKTLTEQQATAIIEAAGPAEEGAA